MIWYSNLFKRFRVLASMQYRATFQIIKRNGDNRILNMESYRFEAEDDTQARMLAEEQLSKRLSEIRSIEIATEVSDESNVFVIYRGDFPDIPPPYCEDKS
jgi:hypothetical protein